MITNQKTYYESRIKMEIYEYNFNKYKIISLHLILCTGYLQSFPNVFKNKICHSIINPSHFYNNNHFIIIQRQFYIANNCKDYYTKLAIIIINKQLTLIICIKKVELQFTLRENVLMFIIPTLIQILSAGVYKKGHILISVYILRLKVTVKLKQFDYLVLHLQPVKQLLFVADRISQGYFLYYILFISI